MDGQVPKLAITMGDPAGIGPEVVVKALAERESATIYIPVLIGDRRLVDMAARAFAPRFEVAPIENLDDAKTPGQIYVYDVNHGTSDGAYELPHAGSATAGQAAFEGVSRAAQLALENKVDAIVTAPLNKGALNAAGWAGIGHTELLADICGVPRNSVSMLLASDKLKVTHASTHVPLSRAISELNTDRLVKVASLTSSAVTALLGRQASIAMAGLNPHAGERGLFGEEDEQIIRPAVKQAKELGLGVSGPISPDTVFLRALNGEFDAVVAMYHDQGHIPSKLVSVHDTVNVTLGLPIVRTSVDHGTAYDIAWSGQASHQNMKSAIRVALAMSQVHGISSGGRRRTAGRSV